MREELWNGFVAENPEDAFRLTADSFLLADFASVPRGGKVCDLGCGAGAIGMMLLADDPSISLTGIERLADQAVLAERCIRQNGCQERADILCADWRKLPSRLYTAFDTVVSNPPYFSEDAEASDPARSEQNGGLDDLCSAAEKLLKVKGQFFLVYRSQRLVDLFCALRRHHLEPKLLRLVRHRANARCMLALIRAVKGGKPSLICGDDLILYRDDGSETDECRRIYHHKEENDS